MTDAESTMREPGIGEPGQPLLSVMGLSVSATASGRERVLVRGVSFELAAGQTLGIVGESGSGKSMTVRSVVGLLPAGVRATGHATFGGLELIGARERALRAVRGSRISLILQDPFTMLNPLQTAGEHIRESLRSIGSDRSELRADVVRRLAEVGLDAEVAERYPFQLSGGQRQRVALAAAMAGDPQLLIADEPTTALDVTTQDEVLKLLRSLQQQRGMGLVLVTHDLRVAFTICDRVLVMYAGSVLEEAPAAELDKTPEHPYTLGLLLADPPVSHFVERLSPIPGNVPAADAVAEQCAFADRCVWKRDLCLETRPQLRPLDPYRASACVRIDDIRIDIRARRAQLQAAGVPPVAQVGEPIAELQSVRKTYRSVGLIGRARVTTALRGVSFQVMAGESVGLVGESGSGKTTLARSMLGLVTPDSGTIRLQGIDVSNYRRLSRAQRVRVRRLVQVVFQDPYSSLNPALSVGTALREALTMGGAVTDHDREIAELLEMVGLPTSYAARRPAALSGGERQRAAIARSLAVRPSMLICDEPVASLDVSVQAQILDVLRGVRQRYEMSMLFITHDLSVVRQMTDRVVVLYQGEVVEQGATPSVLDAPQHPYTMRLLASLPGRVGTAGGDHAADSAVTGTLGRTE